MKTKENIKEWLLNDIFPFNSDLQRDDIGVIVDDKRFIKVQPLIYKNIFDREKLPFDLVNAIFVRNDFGVKFSKFCYYLTIHDYDNDIDITFTIDTNTDGLFGITLSNKLITQIYVFFNVLENLNRAINEVRDEYFYIESIIIDITNKNIFINYIDSRNQEKIKHAYNDLQMFRSMQNELPEFYRVFSSNGYLGK